ncbi:magnesium and cobalt transport protein CorA [Nakamurella sp.]|uniref:magnesium and cobalt transport protein CorA n=1 Tax=Nakamurella sp. TaxID=1869182 RepID=UPI003B3B5444
MPVLPSLPSLRHPRQRSGSGSAAAGGDHAEALVDCAAYIGGERVRECGDPATAIDRVRAEGRGFVWIGLHEPDEREMAFLAKLLGLHELAVEDAVQAYQRPKLEAYDNSLFLVLKTVAYVEHTAGNAVQIVQDGEIMIFLGPDYIVTVRHGAHSQLRTVRAALEDDPDRLIIGPAAVMHAIADHIVDEYLSVVEAVEDDIDEMENSVFTPNQPVDIEQIYLLKREILGLRRAVSPLMPAMRSLSGTSTDLLPKKIRSYVRDVEDHLSVVADRVTTFDEMLTTLVSAALAEVTTRQNEDMRKISAWAAIALVPTAIAGIYGMNFANMPELNWTFGYPMALAVIAGLCVTLYLVLRRRGWL